MIQIDLKNRLSIYEQIIIGFKKLIINGVLKEDERVPSVRDMAKNLTVNPNTVQKAYKELENQGYFYTVSGQGSFIASPQGDNFKKEIDKAYSAIESSVRQLLFMGENKEGILSFVQNLWEVS